MRASVLTILLAAACLVPTSARAQERGIELLGQIGGACRALDISGHYAYVGEGPNLVVLDITTPTCPARLATIMLPQPATDLCAAGQTLFVADDTEYIHIVNVSNPSLPTVVGYINPVSAHTHTEHLAVSGSVLYATRRKWNELTDFQVFDIANPSSPAYLGRYGL